MTKMIDYVCVCFVLFHCMTDALMLPSPLQLSKGGISSFRELRREMSAASASMPEDSYEYRSDDALLDDVRQELVQKYLDQGEALSKAQQEVDYFLQDAGRSREYMSMRKYNLTQKEDGLGLDLFVGTQFLVAFIIGFMINAIQDQDISRIWETLF